MYREKFADRIIIVDDFFLTGNNEDVISHYGLKGRVLYDINRAPYHRSLLVSVSDEKDVRLVMARKKTDDIYGIGIDLISKKRIRKHDFSNTDIFYPEELRQINDRYENYLTIISIKEACFKALSPLYRKERVSAGIFDIETGKIIKAHNRSKKILDKYQGELIHQVIEDDDYVFTVAVCRKI